MTTVRGARARARIEITAAIKDEARTQLAAEGAAKLSLRAVARELGMVSSALYRYFPSRDDLLTALIVDAYDAVGAAAERAAAEAETERPLDRWTTVCRAVRAWAVAHPHEYALIYGSPVPGYTAPQDTIVPASRVGLVLIGIARQAHTSEGLVLPPLAEALRPEAVRMSADLVPDLPRPSRSRSSPPGPSSSASSPSSSSASSTASSRTATPSSRRRPAAWARTWGCSRAADPPAAAPPPRDAPRGAAASQLLPREYG